MSCEQLGLFTHGDGTLCQDDGCSEPARYVVHCEYHRGPVLGGGHVERRVCDREGASYFGSAWMDFTFVSMNGRDEKHYSPRWPSDVVWVETLVGWG